MPQPPLPDPRPSRRASRLSRRTALLAGALLTGGCGVELPRRPAAEVTTPPPSGWPPDPPVVTGSPTPGALTAEDLALAAELATAISGVRELARRTGRKHPELRGLAARLVEVHDEHARLLADAGGGSSFPGGSTAVPGRPAPARARLLDAEGSLAAALRAGSLQAAGGPLARALGSMFAAVEQQLWLQGRSGAAS